MKVKSYKRASEEAVSKNAKTRENNSQNNLPFSNDCFFFFLRRNSPIQIWASCASYSMSSRKQRRGLTLQSLRSTSWGQRAVTQVLRSVITNFESWNHATHSWVTLFVRNKKFCLHFFLCTEITRWRVKPFTGSSTTRFHCSILVSLFSMQHEWNKECFERTSLFMFPVFERLKEMTRKWVITLQSRKWKERPVLWGSHKNVCSNSWQQHPNHKMKTELLFMFRHEKSGRVQSFAPCFGKTIFCTGLVAWNCELRMSLNKTGVSSKQLQVGETTDETF